MPSDPRSVQSTIQSVYVFKFPLKIINGFVQIEKWASAFKILSKVKVQRKVHINGDCLNNLAHMFNIVMNSVVHKI
jgi:hypothetical protein